jgi:hypothetical protein
VTRRLIFRARAVVRMVERGIGVEEVQSVVNGGETIEDERPIHVVAADDPESDITVVITVYQPDPELWQSDFRTRQP